MLLIGKLNFSQFFAVFLFCLCEPVNVVSECLHLPAINLPYTICANTFTLMHYCKHTAGHSAPGEDLNNTIKA